MENKGNEPDWERLRLLCHPMAVFFQPPGRDSDSFRAVDIEGFFEIWRADLDRGLRRVGFNERLARHETTSYSRIAHSYVVYEVRIDPAEEAPRQRGVDSISLVRHEGRWWVSSIDTEAEVPGLPRIPDRILPGGDGGR